MKALVFLALLCGGTVLGGCAHSNPNDRLATSTASVRAAQEAGAPGDPQAALYLKLAQEELDQGRAAIARGDEDAAVKLLRRSAADAELSVALAHKAGARAQDDETRAQLRAIQTHSN